MNYIEMSDVEINKAVAEIIYPGKEFTAAYSFGHPLGPQVQWIQGYGEYLVKNYCNSWADAGPIIAANKITLSAPMKYDYPSEWLAYPSSDSDICISHPNPLRASMIVFLMMQEKSNE